MNIGGVFGALRAGWVLRDPKTWKERTVAVNALAGLLSALLAIAQGAGYATGLHLDGDVVVSLAGGVWAAVAAFNSWSTVATTDKIGLLPARGAGGSGDADPNPGA